MSDATNALAIVRAAIQKSIELGHIEWREGCDGRELFVDFERLPSVLHKTVRNLGGQLTESGEAVPVLLEAAAGDSLSHDERLRVFHALSMHHARLSQILDLLGDSDARTTQALEVANQWGDRARRLEQFGTPTSPRDAAVAGWTKCDKGEDGQALWIDPFLPTDVRVQVDALLARWNSLQPEINRLHRIERDSSLSPKHRVAHTTELAALYRAKAAKGEELGFDRPCLDSALWRARRLEEHAEAIEAGRRPNERYCEVLPDGGEAPIRAAVKAHAVRWVGKKTERRVVVDWEKLTSEQTAAVRMALGMLGAFENELVSLYATNTTPDVSYRERGDSLRRVIVVYGAIGDLRTLLGARPSDVAPQRCEARRLENLLKLGDAYMAAADPERSRLYSRSFRRRAVATIDRWHVRRKVPRRQTAAPRCSAAPRVSRGWHVGSHHRAAHRRVAGMRAPPEDDAGGEPPKRRPEILHQKATLDRSLSGGRAPCARMLPPDSASCSLTARTAPAADLARGFTNYPHPPRWGLRPRTGAETLRHRHPDLLGPAEGGRR